MLVYWECVSAHSQPKVSFLSFADRIDDKFYKFGFNLHSQVLIRVEMDSSPADRVDWLLCRRDI